jgi:putative NIF3 family GTP cyclohydrolase 1 type 2
MMEHRVSCYAMHTNYDVKRMADLAAERMKLKNMQVLEPTTADGSEGIGYTGDLETPVSLETYARHIKEWFHIPDVRVYGNLNRMIRRVSVCPGSAKGMEDFAIGQESDVLIGGDFGHHEGLDCLEKHIAVIDAGHYGLEHIFIDDMALFLEKNCPDIQVYKAPVRYPFQTV